MKAFPRAPRKVRVLRCPICREPIRFREGEPLPEAFPFCSPRCKMVDLYNWFNEEYVLGRELTPEEQAQLDAGTVDTSTDDDDRLPLSEPKKRLPLDGEDEKARD